MQFINDIFGAVFDGILSPFRAIGPFWAVAVLALPTSMGMLWVFKRTSDQVRIARVKRLIQASIFEIRLFNDDMGAILRAQGRILLRNFQYVGLSLVPMVFLIIPFFIVIGQLQAHYAWSGLSPEAPVLLKVELSEGWEQQPDMLGTSGAEKPQLHLAVPDGIRLETSSVWVPSEKQMVWRIAGEQEGEFEISMQAGQASYTRSVYVGGVEGARTPTLSKPNLAHQAMYPAEGTLDPAGPVQSITLDYPDRNFNVLDLSGWVLAYLGLTIAFAFALKGRFGVTI